MVKVPKTAYLLVTSLLTLVFMTTFSGCTKTVYVPVPASTPTARPQPTPTNPPAQTPNLSQNQTITLPMSDSVNMLPQDSNGWNAVYGGRRPDEPPVVYP